MYYNELKYELEKNLKIIEQRNDIFRDIIRHTRNDEGENQTIIDVLNRDIEYKYKEKIKELKNNLSNEKKLKKIRKNIC